MIAAELGVLDEAVAVGEGEEVILRGEVVFATVLLPGTRRTSGVCSPGNCLSVRNLTIPDNICHETEHVQNWVIIVVSA